MGKGQGFTPGWAPAARWAVEGLCAIHLLGAHKDPLGRGLVSRDHPASLHGPKVLSQGREYRYATTRSRHLINIVRFAPDCTPFLPEHPPRGPARHDEEPMSRTDCPSEETLSAFVLGDLPEPELSEVAEHLDACTECEERIGRLDRAADAVVDGLRRIAESGQGSDLARTEGSGSGETSALPAATEDWGEFRIVREIGRGGMGVVCEAYQGSLNRHVAVKFLPERGDLARFRREARAAGRLHHTNIVPVFGVGEHQGRAYLRHAVHRRPRPGPGAQGPRRASPTAPAPSRAGSTTARRHGSACRRPRRWPMPTPRASSTATSSRRTSCSTSGGRCG